MKTRLRQWVESRQAAACGLALGVLLTAALQAEGWMELLINLLILAPLGIGLAWLFWRGDRNGGGARRS